MKMVMKRRGGTNSKIVERMLNVFNLHFPTSAVKAMSRICACKTERNLQCLAGACNSNSHARGLHYLTFVCKNKAGKSTK
jgi:hypothetical protein